MQQPKSRVSSQTGTPSDNALTEHACENRPLKQEDKKSEQFDEMLSAAIDKTLRYVLGDINTSVVYNYLEKKGCSLKEIPANPGEFSTELRNILGSGRGQILGAASILEETILEILCKELEIDLDIPKPAQFADTIKKLRNTYIKRKTTALNRSDATTRMQL